MTTDADEILRRLDLIQATLALAFAPQIAEAGERIRSDPASAAILDVTADWVDSKELQEQVAKRTSMSTRRVRDRLPQLLAAHVLESRGTERQTQYRRTGLI